MTESQLPEESIFLRALEIESAAERAAFVEQACSNDAPLRAGVESLLRASKKSGDLLDFSLRPAICGSDPTTDHAAKELPGTLIGPYKLLEQIGEGGMGLVYMAEQQRPLRRLVALKLIKPGMDSKQVIARFEAEKQALAMMDHENIAKVFEAGTTDSGRFYFAMELVRGIPINEFCDQKRLSVRERLALFIQVCQAVQHAHQKGIIHRDLKPSNVLVTMHDVLAVPKVIDFGIAKALGQQLTEHTLHTGFAQLVGTPLYMSPEQAEMNQLGVDTRSDVYSLGVLLYELLTGTTPFDKETLSKAGLDEMRRMIREDDPLRPSARISTLQAPALSTISQRRSTDPRRISATLRGELDWIVMKSLEKDRSRRYESASALATDIQRYLSDEPVLACPPTTMYRFQKFARKHKPAFATAAAIALCLLLGTTVSAWQAIRATAAEEQAAANETQAKVKAKEATTERDEAQKQRDEAKALADKLVAKDLQLQRTLYAAHMNLAHNAFEAGAPVRLRQLLAQHRPQPGETDLRGFEWHYLNRLFPADLLVLKHAPAVVRCVAYSPDGKRLATGSHPFGSLQNRIVSVWDAQTGAKLFSHKVTSSFHNLTFSPDGKRVASSGKIWNAETGQELLSFSEGEGPAAGFGVAFSPDGKRLATDTVTGPNDPRTSGSRDQKIAIWDAQTGERLLTLKGHGTLGRGQIRGLAFSPDGKRLASSSQDKTVKLWDAETGQVLHTLEGHTGAVTGIAYSQDGQRLASASMDKTVKLWDALSGIEVRTLRGHTGIVFGVAFSPDGHQLASASEDTTVKVWDVESGDELFTLQRHTKPVWSVAFSPDGKHLASAADDGTVKVREAKPVQKALVLSGGGADVHQVAFSPDGKRLTSLSGLSPGGGPFLGKAQVWDTQTGEQVLAIDSGAGPVFSSLSPDGSRLAVAQNRTGQTNVWDLRTGEKLLLRPLGFTWRQLALSPNGNRLVSTRPSDPRMVGGKTPQPIADCKVLNAKTGRVIRSFEGPVGGIIFSPDGKRVAGTTEDGTFKLWDLQTGDEILTIKGAAGGAVFSPDGKRLAGTAGGTVKLWDVQTGDELLTLTGAAGRVDFSPDGKLIVSGSQDATVKRVWDAQTGNELSALKGHSGAISGVAFSPDSKRLATTSSDATIKIWDSETGQELLTLAGSSFRLNGVAFSPDGLRLAAGGPNGTVMIYDATPLPEKP